VRKSIFRWIVLVSILAMPVAPLLANEAKEPKEKKDPATFAEALKDGDYGINLRYRYEHVSDDAERFDGRNGIASTLRTTIDYRSLSFHGFGIKLQAENVTDIGHGLAHNNLGADDLWNGVTDRPAIPDPEITVFQQVELRYDGLRETGFYAGRQELNLREQRFVGAVGWRQHHQTFDAFHVDTKALSRTHVTYAYLDRQNNVLGGSNSMGSNVLMVDIDAGSPGTLTVYGIDLDYDRVELAGLSTRTFGARWKGAFDVGDAWKIPYHVELADQSDTGKNPANVDAGYLRLEVGGKCKLLWVKAGYELLGGSLDDGRFTTPLATLHKWNGWADKFLNTPATGLEDVYIGAGIKRGKTSGVLVYHDFSADSGGADYGTELDLLVSWTAPWSQTFAAKAAFYDADDFAADTDKYWLYTTYSF
jgi:hypothetical protein